MPFWDLLDLFLACLALAWSDSAQTSEYRITAKLDTARLRSISLAPQTGMAAKPSTPDQRDRSGYDGAAGGPHA
ncbi:MAG TPA: hypothetical protein VNT42_12510 [Sphingomonas sp.]|nr:hypothetical protein [Sphingomonas sp.]